MSKLFYPLTNDEWLKLIARLNYAEIKLLMHLRTINPFGDRLTEVEVKPIAAELGITSRTVQRALVGLAEKDLIELEFNKCKFRLKKVATDLSDDDKRIATDLSDDDKRIATDLSDDDKRIASRDRFVLEATEMSPARQECRERAPKPLPGKGFGTSHTIKTLKDSSDSIKEERETRAREKNSEPVENPSMGNPTPTEPDYAIQPIAPINESTSKTNSSAAPSPVAKELPPWRLSWEPQDYDPDFCQDVLRRMQKQWPERTLGDAIAKISNAEAANRTKQIALDYDAFRFPKPPPPNQPACVPLAPTPTIPPPPPPDPLDQHLAQLRWSKTRAIQHMIEHHGWPDILTQTGTLRGGTIFNWNAKAIGARAEQLRSAIAALVPTDQGDLIAQYEATLLRAGMSKREAIAHMVASGYWQKVLDPGALTEEQIEQVIEVLGSIGAMGAKSHA